jgi:glycosyltransferase involved in cell wall biosynthesis
LLAACDLLVHSSRSEGSPNAVLEAMAAGLPVVATDLPTIRELLGDQAQGCVAPPGDEAAWARRILTFMDDPQLRQTIGADLAERARLRHDPCRIVAQWAQLMAREPESR